MGFEDFLFEDFLFEDFFLLIYFISIVISFIDFPLYFSDSIIKIFYFCLLQHSQNQTKSPSIQIYLNCFLPNSSKSQFHPLTSMKVIKHFHSLFSFSGIIGPKKKEFYYFIAVQLKRSQLANRFFSTVWPLTICHLQIWSQVNSFSIGGRK